MNTFTYSKDWYKTIKNDLSADQKKERVKQMREKNKRMKEIQVTDRNAPNMNISSPKGINPDERPIKSSNNYGFGQAIAANPDERPIGGGAPVQPANQADNGGGMMMTFDFSAPKPPPKAKAKKRTFLKRGEGAVNKRASPKKQVSKIEEEPEEESPKKSIDTQKSSPSKKGKFLKKGEKLVYDPLRAVKEEKERKKKEKQMMMEKMKREQEIKEEIERCRQAGEDPSELISMLQDEGEEELANAIS